MRNIVAVIQARSGSHRLPDKVLIEISGISILAFIHQRLSASKYLTKIVFAVPESDTKLIEYLTHNDMSFFCGSEYDVLDRVYRCAENFCADTVVRLTADNPLIDPSLIDEMIAKFDDQKVDYLGFGMHRTFPTGFGTEIVSFSALESAWKSSTETKDREHVTWYVRSHPQIYKLGEHRLPQSFSHIRVTMDYPEDLVVIRNIIEEFEKQGLSGFGYRDVIELYQKKPELFAPNKEIKGHKISSPNPLSN